MRHLFFLTGLAAVAWTAWKSLRSQETQQTSTHQQFEGFSVTRTSLPDNGEVIRFRGSYDDIMRSFGVIQDEKPPLPEDLDIESLPKYNCGCPHCGKMSMWGENMWRYQELSRTRGPWDNTTTYLTRCKNCQGFMKSTVDHDE